jgi:hypothetical protein
LLVRERVWDGSVRGSHMAARCADLPGIFGHANAVERSGLPTGAKTEALGRVRTSAAEQSAPVLDRQALENE